MGVTTGGLLATQSQTIEIKIPSITNAADAAAFSQELQTIIDWFNAQAGAPQLQVVSVVNV